MTNTSHPPLTERLTQKQAEQAAQIDQLLSANLTQLEESLKKHTHAAQSIIDENMAALQHAIRAYRLRPWIYPLIATLLVVPATLSGWILLDYLITGQVQTLQRHHKALKALGPAGIQHAVRDGTLYLVLPEDAKKPDVFKATTGRWVVTLEE